MRLSSIRVDSGLALPLQPNGGVGRQYQINRVSLAVPTVLDRGYRTVFTVAGALVT